MGKLGVRLVSAGGALGVCGVWLAFINHHHPRFEWLPHAVWHLISDHWALVMLGGLSVLIGGHIVVEDHLRRSRREGDIQDC